MKLLKILGLVFLTLLSVSSIYAGNSFNVIAEPVEDISTNSVTLKGEIINPKNRELDLYINIKKENETQYNEELFVSGISQSKFNINVYQDNLSPTTQYNYYFRVEEDSKNSVTSNIINFQTLSDSGSFNFDLDDDFNQLFLLLMLIFGVVFLFTSFKLVSSLLFIIVGLLLLFNGFTYLFSFSLIAVGFGLLFWR